MSKNFDYSSKEVSKNIEDGLQTAKKIGEGHNGVVFLFEDGRTVKFFRRHDAWQDESYILKKVDGSKFFPKIKEVGDNYIVRDYVDGERLDKYLRTHKMDERLAGALYEMTIEFEKLKFRRLDIRCKDIFYNIEKGKVKIIDPKKNYSKKVSYPRHLMKGLYKKDALKIFLNFVKSVNVKKGSTWEIKIEGYLKSNKK
ncbi:hypothetical protein [uncultured Clostridium sp.]|jgi:predicted Ser/Thr protein kinase|uniref:hypothetical protein n=1 Tax=uncultured Clostridium sp. TaxID=59620 RepID=UPI00262F8A2C|nr:hypothetical protein [uncultured Clostridium sp.]